MYVSNKARFESEFAALQSSYSATVETRIEEIDCQLQRLLRNLDGESDFRVSSADVLQSIHKTVGSAATFGLPEVSRAARNLEDLLSTTLATERQPKDAEVEKIRDMSAKLKLVTRQYRCDPDSASCGNPPDRFIADEPVLLIHDRPDDAALIVDCLREIGFDTIVADVLDEGLDQIEKVMPKAIFLSGTMTIREQYIRKVAENTRRLPQNDVPLIVLAHENRFDTQLTAFRAGADAFLVEPLQPDDVLRLFDEHKNNTSMAPFRVLIVEDDDALAEQCASALEGPGYTNRICRDPDQLFSLVASFDPEIIVVDLSLTHCSGLELAKIVWQNDFGRHIDIAFLSPGGEFSDTAGKLGLTLERFVSRPISADRLRSCVASLVLQTRSKIECPARQHLISALNNQRHLEKLHQSLGIEEKCYIPSITGSSAQPNTNPKVLVVDDDPYMVEAISAKLKSFDLEAVQSFSASQALAMVQAEQPDVIISDYEMPEGSADYLLTKLKGNAGTREIPVLILTARTLDGRKDFSLEREMLGRHGAVSYLSKPVNWDVLVGELRRHIDF